MYGRDTRPRDGAEAPRLPQVDDLTTALNEARERGKLADELAAGMREAAQAQQQERHNNNTGVAAAAVSRMACRNNNNERSIAAASQQQQHRHNQHNNNSRHLPPLPTMYPRVQTQRGVPRLNYNNNRMARGVPRVNYNNNRRGSWRATCKLQQQQEGLVACHV